MPKITTQFSTEILGYDNDAMPGIVAENVWGVINMLAVNLAHQSIDRVDYRVSQKVLETNKAIVDSMSLTVVDTGVILPTIKHKFFSDPEETEYKEQTVTITFETTIPTQTVKQFLLDALAYINNRIEKVEGTTEAWRDATLWHKKTERDIMISLIDSFTEIV